MNYRDKLINDILNETVEEFLSRDRTGQIMEAAIEAEVSLRRRLTVGRWVDFLRRAGESHGAEEFLAAAAWRADDEYQDERLAGRPA